MTGVLKDDPRKFAESEKIPEAIRPFVFRCLEKDPADRYQSARDLMLDLRAYQAEGLREAAERVQFRAEPPWKHRRTRVLLRALGGVLLFVLGAFAGSCWQKSRDGRAGIALPAGAGPRQAEAIDVSSSEDPAVGSRVARRSFGSGIGDAQHASRHAS
jgi:hypothetical protein